MASFLSQIPLAHALNTPISLVNIWSSSTVSLMLLALGFLLLAVSIVPGPIKDLAESPSLQAKLERQSKKRNQRQRSRKQNQRKACRFGSASGADADADEVQGLPIWTDDELPAPADDTDDDVDLTNADEDDDIERSNSSIVTSAANGNLEMDDIERSSSSIVTSATNGNLEMDDDIERSNSSIVTSAANGNLEMDDDIERSSSSIVSSAANGNLEMLGPSQAAHACATLADAELGLFASESELLQPRVELVEAEVCGKCVCDPNVEYSWGCSHCAVYSSGLLLAHRTIGMRIRASGPPGLTLEGDKDNKGELCGLVSKAGADEFAAI